MNKLEAQPPDIDTPEGYKAIQKLLVDGLKSLNKRKDIFDAARRKHQKDNTLTLEDLETPIRGNE